MKLTITTDPNSKPADLEGFSRLLWNSYLARRSAVDGAPPAVSVTPPRWITETERHAVAPAGYSTAPLVTGNLVGRVGKLDSLASKPTLAPLSESG